MFEIVGVAARDADARTVPSVLLRMRSCVVPL
jgi:hypothetical protein